MIVRSLYSKTQNVPDTQYTIHPTDLFVLESREQGTASSVSIIKYYVLCREGAFVLFNVECSVFGWGWVPFRRPSAQSYVPFEAVADRSRRKSKYKSSERRASLVRSRGGVIEMIGRT